jgi:glutamate--cysteine ligase
MPLPRPTLTLADAVERIHECCRAPAHGAGLVGVEVEWFVIPRGRPEELADHEVVRAAVEGPLPGGSRITWEPGGQLELSSRPLDGPGEACAVLAGDLAVVRDRLETIGHALVSGGVDAHREAERVVDRARYRAMETYFDAGGPDGRRMMRATAAVQVNVDAGRTPEEQAMRWRRAHLLGPVLAAACACSPVRFGRPTGWHSTRLGIWSGIDPTRTRPVDGHDPCTAWTEYALDARVMFIRVAEDDCVPLARALTLREWLREGHALGYPTAADVTEHLTTLFPPVRYRGWLEVRVADSLPDPWWRVPVAVTAAALDSRVVDEVCVPVAGEWEAAARHGLAHPGLAHAARAVFDDALTRLEARDTDPLTTVTVAEFIDRFVARGRSPADEMLAGMREPTGIA